MDLEVREFTNSIVKFINDSKLPAEVKRLVMHKICTELDAVAENIIQTQIAERQNAAKKEEKGRNPHQYRNKRRR